MITILRRNVACNIWAATLKVKVTAWAVSIIVSELFHINDHHVETTCRAQHLGRYLEGQGHSVTFQQNNFRPITLWFEVEYYNYFTGIITILRQCVACNIWSPILQLLLTNYFSVSNTYSGSITRFWPALVFLCCRLIIYAIYFDYFHRVLIPCIVLFHLGNKRSYFICYCF